MQRLGGCPCPVGRILPLNPLIFARNPPRGRMGETGKHGVFKPHGLLSLEVSGHGNAMAVEIAGFQPGDFDGAIRKAARLSRFFCGIAIIAVFF